MFDNGTGLNVFFSTHSVLNLREMMRVYATSAEVNDHQIVMDLKTVWNESLLLSDWTFALTLIAERRTEVLKLMYITLKDFANPMQAP